jgi:hypothetical protein
MTPLNENSTTKITLSPWKKRGERRYKRDTKEIRDMPSTLKYFEVPHRTCEQLVPWSVLFRFPMRFFHEMEHEH